MMLPQTLTPEASKQSLLAHSYRQASGYRRAACLAACVMSVIAGALACNGTIDATEQPPLSGSSTSGGNNGVVTDSSPRPGATGTTPRQTPPTGVGESELDNDNVRGVDSESGAARRRGGSGRARADEREDDEQVDAGVEDAGEIVADAGEIDAGVVLDAGPDADAAP
jgi:hypothetical protein